MKSKGFTLIELLAVIVILAIIALIATPIILGIINNTKEEANERSVELYASAVKNGMIAYQMREGQAVASGTYTVETLPFEVEYDGDVDCNVIQINEDGTVALTECTVNNQQTDYTYGNLEYTESSCFTHIDNYEYTINEQVCITLFGATADSMLGDGAGALICSGDDTYGDLIYLGYSIGYTKDQLEQAGVIEEVKELGTISVVGYTCNGLDVVMPSKINNKTVTKIEAYAFNEKSLTSVIIPNGVIYINERAFEGNQLTSLTIPSSVKTIGLGAFENNQLTNLVISNGVTNIGADAFRRNLLTSLVIPNSVTTIGDSAFAYNQITKTVIQNKKENVTIEFSWTDEFSEDKVIWEG